MDCARRLRRRVAIVLLGLFGVQSGLRLLGMVPPFQRMPIDVAIVHAFDLLALVGVTIVSLRAANGKMLLLVPLALALAAIGVVLTAFDVASLVAIEYHQRVTTLPAVATFYCNRDSIRSCIAPYPGIALAVAAVWLVWAGLIAAAGAALAGIAARAVRPLTRAGRAPCLPTLLIAGGVILWSAVWLTNFGEMVVREPLVRFVTRSPLGPQPRELSTIPRPDYHVAPTPGSKPRFLVLITIDSLRADAVDLAPERPSRARPSCNRSRSAACCTITGPPPRCARPPIAALPGCCRRATGRRCKRGRR